MIVVLCGNLRTSFFCIGSLSVRSIEEVDERVNLLGLLDATLRTSVVSEQGFDFVTGYKASEFSFVVV